MFCLISPWVGILEHRTLLPIIIPCCCGRQILYPNVTLSKNTHFAFCQNSHFLRCRFFSSYFPMGRCFWKQDPMNYHWPVWLLTPNFAPQRHTEQKWLNSLFTKISLFRVSGFFLHISPWVRVFANRTLLTIIFSVWTLTHNFVPQ